MDAIGASIIGPHEDIAQARLNFSDGAVVNLTASRMSYRPERTMQVYAENGFAEIDFGTPSLNLIRPTMQQWETIAQAKHFTATAQADLRDHLFDKYLPLTEVPIEKQNAILLEQHDFVQSIISSTLPRVTGDHGLQALEVADEIIAQVEAHEWLSDSAEPIRGFELSPNRRKAG